MTDGSSRTVLIRRSDRLRIPWKNGAGATEVIATGEGQPPAWRISVADLSTGRTTFSSFPGLHRVFTVVGDHGVTLSWVGRTVELDPLEPCPFDGELAPDCVASGPTSAFNVMVDASAATVHVEPLHLAHSAVFTDPDATTVVYVHRGSLASGDHAAGTGDCLVGSPSRSPGPHPSWWPRSTR
ncbi:HutD family protein [Mycobacterium hodleri]|uniref:HutD family protein n=1 Tax=Mycolicibacterium hodleri TaxID=49897 RepID=UPI0021F389C7|nr:HutD family protein [Mycolicibacterium hodleri]MCV7133909.1 HutD family protein [Mycolicibacterium hodleri]